MGLGWYGLALRGDRAKHYPAIVEHRFADGHVFQVLEAKLGMQLEMTYASERPFYDFATRSGRSNNGSYAYNSFRLHVWRDTGELSRALISRDQPSLFLVVRMLDPRGQPVVNRHFMFSNRREKAREIIWDRGNFTTSNRVSFSSPPPLKYDVEVDGGSGVWLPTLSPLVPQVQDGRAFVLTEVFYRRDPELQLRVKLPGQPDATVRIPNPGYKPDFPTFTAQAPPWEMELDEVKVRIDRVDSTSAGPGGPVNLPRFKIEPLNGQNPNIYRFFGQVVRDETGNVAASPRVMARLPNLGVLQYEGLVQRDRYLYPWPRAGNIFILQGTASGPGSSFSLTPTKGAAKYGITAAEVKSAGIDKWELTIRGEADEADLPPPLTNWLEDMSLYLDGEATSVKHWEGRSSSLSGPTTKRNYRATHVWSGSLTSGQKVEVGIYKEMPEQKYEFRLPAYYTP